MFEFEFDEHAFIFKSEKEHLKLGPEGMVLTCFNLTPEEKAFVLQNKELLELVYNIKIVIEESKNNG